MGREMLGIKAGSRKRVTAQETWKRAGCSARTHLFRFLQQVCERDVRQDSCGPRPAGAAGALPCRWTDRSTWVSAGLWVQPERVPDHRVSKEEEITGPFPD